jgi:hypothetical protein
LFNARAFTKGSHDRSQALSGQRIAVSATDKQTFRSALGGNVEGSGESDRKWHLCVHASLAGESKDAVPSDRLLVVLNPD